MNKTIVTKDLENKLLVIERTFDVSREKLWKAFADKEWFEKWWGPEGWETTTKEFNFVSGGTVHYCMTCVDQNQTEWFGQEAWGIMKLESINEPENFSYVDFFSDAEGTIDEALPAITVTNKFIELDGKTTFISRSIANSAEDIEKLIAMGMVEGFNSSTDKLERLVEAQ